MTNQMRALYSVVQYVPDGGRAEAANVGVVLFVPEPRILEVRVSESLERVRRFFRPGRRQIQRIESALDAFKHRLELARGELQNESDLAQFAAARADAIRLTIPRIVIVHQWFSDLDALYRELVGDRERAILDAAAQVRPLPPHVAEVFGRLEAQRKIWRPGHITLPTTDTRFDVPIAFLNGRVNYVRPESLTGGRLEDRMAKLGFNGQLIYKHPVDNKEGRLVVLSADPDADERTEQRFDRALQDFNVRFVPYSKGDAFADEVERTAH